MAASSDIVSTNPNNKPCIGVATRSAGNRHLLKQLLSNEYEIVEDIDNHSLGNAAVDMLIIDLPTLKEVKQVLHERRNAEKPAILPTLLIMESRLHAQTYIDQELGSTVEDVLWIPTNSGELKARIDNLVRLSLLSRNQQQRQRQTEEELRVVNRTLHTLNRCNEVLVREADEQQLLEKICQVITEEGEYSLAFIALAKNDERKSLVFRASAGSKISYIDNLFISWDGDDDEYGQGPAGHAIRTGQTVVSPNLAADTGFAAWRDRALAYELAAVISLPLQGEHGMPGVLNVYADKPGTFSSNERELLERLAENLTYGIDALRNRQQRAQREEEVQKLAYSDVVTGLPNRKALQSNLKKLSLSHEGQNKGFAVLFIDLDGFKIINDARGHNEGDRVLKWAAERLKKIMREEDYLVRQGGDEFIIVMKDSRRQLDSEDNESDEERMLRVSELLAERVLATIREPLSIAGNEYRLDASIGISVVMSETAEKMLNNLDSIINQADIAMYEAKSAQSGWAFYTSAIGEKRQRLLKLDTKLNKALDNDEFTLHYQPLVDLTNRQVVGAEALIRWPQSDGSFISPGEFIPIAEQNGLIRPIGDWVFKRAAEQLREWLDAGLQTYVSVNVSVMQLMDADICSKLLFCLPQGLPASAIKLEVTEGVLLWYRLLFVGPIASSADHESQD